MSEIDLNPFTGLIADAARRYYGAYYLWPLGIDDLMQEGRIAAWKCLESGDSERSHVARCIYQQLSFVARAIAKYRATKPYRDQVRNFVPLDLDLYSPAASGALQPERIVYARECLDALAKELNTVRRRSNNASPKNPVVMRKLIRGIQPFEIRDEHKVSVQRVHAIRKLYRDRVNERLKDSQFLQA